MRNANRRDARARIAGWSWRVLPHPQHGARLWSCKPACRGRNLGAIQKKATLSLTLRNNGQEPGKDLDGAGEIPIAEPYCRPALSSEPAGLYVRFGG